MEVGDENTWFTECLPLNGIKSLFREETDASFKVNTEINKWFDFGLGKGGNILTLASVLYCSESVPYLLRQIEEQAPHICPNS